MTARTLRRLRWPALVLPGLLSLALCMVAPLAHAQGFPQTTLEPKSAIAG